MQAISGSNFRPVYRDRSTGLDSADRSEIGRLSFIWSNGNKVAAVNGNNDDNNIALLSAIIDEFSDDLDIMIT